MKQKLPEAEDSGKATSSLRIVAEKRLNTMTNVALSFNNAGR